MAGPPPKKLRILLAGNTQAGALESCYERALARMPGVEAHVFSVDLGESRPANPSLAYRALEKILSPLRSGATRARLLKTVSSASPAFDAVVVFKGMVFSREALEKCARSSPSTAWINLNPDDPTRTEEWASTNRDVLESLSFFDLYVTWSRSLAARLRERGCRNVARIPFGFDADVHKPPPPGASPAGISFVGTWDPEREAILSGLADLDLRIFGTNWKRASAPALKSLAKGEVIHGERFAREIQSSLVSINLLRPQNADSHNMRTFEIPAVGGLLLTPESPELGEFLTPGEACLTFRDRDDLRAKVESVMRRPGDFEAVRERGLRMISAHSYDARAKALVDGIAELLAARR